jgi:glutamyl-tRNA synthetase
VIDLVKSRARKLADIAGQVQPFFSTMVTYEEAAVKKHLGDSALKQHVEAWRLRLAALEPFDAAAIEAALRALAEARGIKAGALIHATRVAVTGQAVSPGIFEVVELMGRERAIARLKTSEVFFS